MTNQLPCKWSPIRILGISPDHMFLENYSTYLAVFSSTRNPLCTELGSQIDLTFDVFKCVMIVTKQIIGVYNVFKNITKFTTANNLELYNYIIFF